jgi:hypothetical protein
VTFFGHITTLDFYQLTAHPHVGVLYFEQFEPSDGMGGHSTFEELVYVIALNSGEEPTHDRDHNINAPMCRVSQDLQEDLAATHNQLPVTSNGIGSGCCSTSNHGVKLCMQYLQGVSVGHWSVILPQAFPK